MARLGDARRVDARGDDPDFLAAIGQHLAPRIDDQRMAVALAPGRVLAPLRRREDKAAILNRAGAQQHMPVRPAGRYREHRRYGEEIGSGLRQRAIEVREAHIVADTHAEPAPRRLGDDRPAPGTIGVALAIALAAWQVDVEHVDLVVARDDLARAIDEERAVGEPLLAFDGAGLASGIDDQRAEQEPDAQLPRQFAHAGEERV